MPILFTIPTPKSPRPFSSSCLAFASFLFSTSPTTHNECHLSLFLLNECHLSLFLLNECHLSSSQINKIMTSQKSLLRTKSSHTAREAMEFMRDCGFTETQLHKTILRSPQVLTRKVDGHLKPIFDLLTTLGFVGQDLPIFVLKNPRVLACSFEKNLSPRIPFLEKLFGSKRNLFNALKRAPELLIHSVENHIKPKINFFKQWGIEGELILLLLRVNPNILTRASIELLQIREEYVVNTLGITKGSKTFVYALSVLVSNGPETVEKKMKHLQSLGLLEDEVHELVKKDPWSLNFSTKKIQENMEFLTYAAGLQPNVVLSYPFLLRMSIDKRLRPRYAVVRALRAMQKSMPSLPAIFTLSEQKFFQKFVECNPQASMLKEIYKGKDNSTDVETI